MKKLISTLLIIIGLSTFSLSAIADTPDYVETEIWNDSHPIYDSEFYNGMMYTVQLYQNHDKSKWEMRLIELLPNKDATLTDSRHWKLDSGSRKLDYYKHDFFKFNASMEEFNGILYIYIYCNSQNYFFAFQTDDKGEATLTPLKCPVENDRNYAFSMTKYRKALAIFTLVGGSTSTQISTNIEMVYTFDNPIKPSAEWKKIITLASPYPNPGNQSFGENDFDVTNWIGVRDVEINGKTEKQMVEELVIAQYNIDSGCFTVRHFSGEIEDIGKSGIGLWDFSHSKPILPGGYADARGLKMVKGHITGVGNAHNPTDINVPIQFVMSVHQLYQTGGGVHQRQILLYEYDPATRKFHQNTANDTYNFATNLPYGKFGACSVSVPIDGTVHEPGGIETTTYQRYICIFRGAYNTHFDKHTYYSMLKSDQAKVKRSVASTDFLLNSKEGRKACILTGVIEGAPPTVVDNAEMYDAIGGSVSSITFGTSDTESVRTESSTTWGHTNVGGFDNYGAPFTSFSIMAGGGYEVTKTKAKEQTFKSTHTTSLHNSSANMARKGYYIFVVPRLDQYVGQMYSPDGSRQLTGCGDILTFVQTGAHNAIVDYRLDNDSIKDILRIKDPLKLESWKDRHDTLFSNYSDTGRPIYDLSILATTENHSDLETTVTNSSSASKTISWKLMVNTHFYQNDSGGEVTNTTSSSSTVGKNVAIAINPIKDEDLAMQMRDTPVSSYVLQGYFLTNDNPSTIYQMYIDDLIKRGIMDKGDRPFILAWDVLQMGNIHFLSSGVDGIESSYNFSATGGQGCVIVTCDTMQEIEIFTTSGAKVVNGICPEGQKRFDMHPGIYIVRNGNKAVKVCVQ